MPTETKAELEVILRGAWTSGLFTEIDEYRDYLDTETDDQDLIDELMDQASEE